ncbi:MAG: threonine synthase [Rhodospirillales bacterium]|nr:threonine synthase [Rhodospirillales bacterium]
MTPTPVEYVSTRGGAPRLAFADVVLAGLASDGGLYVPAAWPRLSATEWQALSRLSYAELMARVLAAFAAPDVGEAELAALAADAYRDFDHPEVAPLAALGDDHFLLELFHGPTLAFKDYALQVLGRLFDRVLARRGERVTIVGATSGDTGSAAIAACRDREAVEIFILHPRGRVSEVQRRQMTTVDAGNVHNIAVEGTFDDCQDLIKAMFNDPPFRQRWRLSAVNSINWARIAAQVAYYISAALRLGSAGDPVAFAVPTGNFGNVLAGWVAKRMGAPVGRLIIGSNRNDILTRFFATGRMEIEGVVPTLSPSMDIQISSNFERYLFELLGRDGGMVKATMQRFRDAGQFSLPQPLWRQALADFTAYRCDDEQTQATIRDVFTRTGRLVDPHTAVGIAAARSARPDVGGPLVTVATADAAKFPDAVAAATGVRPPLPPRLADLFDRPEHLVALPADLATIQSHISQVLSQKGITG